MQGQGPLLLAQGHRAEQPAARSGGLLLPSLQVPSSRSSLASPFPWRGSVAGSCFQTPLMRRRILEAAASGRRLDLRNHWVPLSAISPILVQVVICSIDRRFFLHRGIDWDRIARAWRYNRRVGRRYRGGSSITMQTVKNVFLSPRKSYLRKALEVPFSYWMELILGKPRILEIYLNVAEWGDGIFGIEAAARQYYGISAAELDLEQALSLSAVLPNPRIWSPVKPTLYIRTIREALRRRVLREGIPA